MFSLHAIGIDMRHTGDFFIDRPEGSGDCLLIIFKTDAQLRLEERFEPVPPDSAVIFRKGEKQCYRSVCGSYVNHFLHFDADAPEELDSEIIRCGELLLPESIPACEDILKLISREQMSSSPNREEYISMLIKLLLMKLSEPISGKERSLTRQHAAALNELRAELYSSAGQFGSVEELAKRTHLSPSHFQQLYRQQFGISCYEDLLSAKIKTAQYYLGTTALSVREIAGLCGYGNEVSFMHRFKQRTGLTPSEYRGMVRK